MKSELYFPKHSHRMVPLSHDVMTNDMLHSQLSVARQHFLPIVRQVSRHIHMVHAAEAEMYFDTVY